VSFELRYFRNIDWWLLAAVLLLLLFGLLMIFSSTRANHVLNGGDPYYFVKRQLVWVIVGVVALGAIMLYDYHLYGKFSRILYLTNVIALLTVLVFSKAVSGSQRWIPVGPVSVQPSEFAKIIVVITLAELLTRESNAIGCVTIGKAFVHIAIPMLLILLQPDLGTAMVYVGIFIGILFLAGADWRCLAGLICTGTVLVLGVVFLSFKGWLPLLHEYQLRRLMVFLDPYADKTGSGWNIIQSMIAVGCGGLFGKGLFQGSQTQLNFLPAHHTDFIFSVVGEEFGFLGASAIILVYLFILWRMILILSRAKDAFGRLICAGAFSLLSFHVIINIAMTLGLMPVTGLPLPFISYGGSSLVTNLLAVGLVLNVGMRCRKIMFP